MRLGMRDNNIDWRHKKECSGEEISAQFSQHQMESQENIKKCLIHSLLFSWHVPGPVVGNVLFRKEE